jgi:hypothetical protein
LGALDDRGGCLRKRVHARALLDPTVAKEFTGSTDRVIVFNSNVQPKRRMKEKPEAWHCNCRKLLGPYRLNLAHLMRCAVCGVAPHSDPTVTKNAKLARQSPTPNEPGRTLR